jgi:hypothetical protein
MKFFEINPLKTIKKWKGLITILFLSFIIISCSQSDFLNKKPSNVIGTEQFFKDPDLIKSNIADLYNRMPRWYGIYDWSQYCNFNEAFPSDFGNYYRVKNQNYGYGFWNYWDYGYLHDINLFLDRIREAKQLTPDTQQRFEGEGQFLRANFYFAEVRSMGGVPMLLDTLKYNFSGNASNLYHKRAPEAKIYDFVISEADSAAQKLPKDPSDKDRATWAAAMTLKSTAALFAGSIAQYNSERTPSVTLSNGVVGIPHNQADHYYKIALSAAQKIIKSGEYHLYMKYPNDLQKNFAQLFLDKNNNPEVIFVKDHKLKTDQTVGFTVDNQPHSISEEAANGGMLNPSLNFVQSFEKLNNTFAPFKIKNPDGTYIRYNTKGAIFKDRDARLGGTVILPGSQFRGQNLDIWAGYYLPQKPKGQRIITGSQFGQKKALPGQSQSVQVVGLDGPIDGGQHATQTGFYIRKYLDPAPSAGELGTLSAVWWIYYRYAEVLLNAAEASFQLGNKTLAAKYINQIRARAGFKTPLLPSQITFKRIVHARLIELAFEGHRLWDMKRWRLADKIWNGGKTDLSHPANPAAPSTRPWGLWPYKVYDPGKPDNGKWIYKRVLPGQATASDHFRIGNYYSQIPLNVMGSNPKLIQNPNQ